MAYNFCNLSNNTVCEKSYYIVRRKLNVIKNTFTFRMFNSAFFTLKMDKKFSKKNKNNLNRSYYYSVLQILVKRLLLKCYNSLYVNLFFKSLKCKINFTKTWFNFDDKLPATEKTFLSKGIKDGRIVYFLTQN